MTKECAEIVCKKFNLHNCINYFLKLSKINYFSKNNYDLLYINKIDTYSKAESRFSIEMKEVVLVDARMPPCTHHVPQIDTRWLCKQT